MKVCNMYKCLYDHYTECIMENKPNDIIFIVTTGLIRMHISAYNNTGEIIDDKEIGK